MFFMLFILIMLPNISTIKLWLLFIGGVMGIPNMFANPPLCTFKESFSFSSVFFFFCREGGKEHNF